MTGRKRRSKKWRLESGGVGFDITVTCSLTLQPIKIHLEHTALEASDTLLWTPHRQMANLTQAIEITGTENLLAVREENFVNLNNAQGGSTKPTVGTPADLDAFIQFWNLPGNFAQETDSILSSGSFQKLVSGTLMSSGDFRFVKASGLPSTKFGADLSVIGPRP